MPLVPKGGGISELVQKLYDENITCEYTQTKHKYLSSSYP